MCLLMDAPQPIAKKGFFTSENARAYAKKGNIARWVKPRSLPKPATEPQPIPATDERLALVQRQITLTRDTLEGKLEPKDRAQLLRALCGLLDRERILRGEPLPGSRKPAPEPRQRVLDQPMAPVPVAPVLHETQPIAAKPIESGQCSMPTTVRETVAGSDGDGI